MCVFCPYLQFIYVLNINILRQSIFAVQQNLFDFSVLSEYTKLKGLVSQLATILSCKNFLRMPCLEIPVHLRKRFVFGVNIRIFK